jgi:hypothetical protein
MYKYSYKSSAARFAAKNGIFDHTASSSRFQLHLVNDDELLPLVRIVSYLHFPSAQL